MTRGKTEGQLPLLVLHGRSHLPVILSLSAPILRSRSVQPKANDLCTRLAGAAKRVRRKKGCKGDCGLGSRRKTQGEFCCNLWRLDRERIGFSCKRVSGQEQDFRVLFLRGAGVREENEWHTDWNVNWSISDVKSKVNPYSSFFDCSISLSSFKLSFETGQSVWENLTNSECRG